MDAFDQRNYLSDKQLVRLKGTVAAAPGAVALAAQVSELTQAYLATQPAVLVGDLLIAVVKPTFQAGIAFVGGRVNAAADLRLWIVNPTAGAITPTGSEVYDIIVAR